MARTSPALYLSTNTAASPEQVRDHLVTNAMAGKVTSPGTGSPNRMVFVVNAAPGNVVTVNDPGNQTGTAGNYPERADHRKQFRRWRAYLHGNRASARSVDRSSGLISGTPTAAGTSNVTVAGTDSTGSSGSVSFTFIVAGGGGG